MDNAKPHKLTPAQREVLTNLATGRRWDAHLSGRSAYGGARSTLMSLQRRGYMKAGVITQEGRNALAERQGEPQQEAMCIGCGCTDFNACYDELEGAACHWRRVDRAAGLGVCSSCRELEKDWDAGDRTMHVPAEQTGK